MQFVLSVPDTSQVKGILSMLSNIIVQQEVTMQSLKSNMVEMRREFADDLHKVLEWSQGNIGALNEENKMLRKVLMNTQNGIKILSCNVQGFDDVHFEGLGSRPMLLADIEMRMNSENRITMTNPNGGSSSTTSENGITSKRTAPSKISKALPKDHAYFTDVYAVKFPTHAAGRWKWALRKILMQLRIRKYTVSYAQAKVSAIADSSIVSRLNRLEAQLLVSELRMHKEIRSDLTSDFNQKLENSNKDISNSFLELKTQTQADLKEANRVAAEVHTTVDEKIVPVLSDLQKKVQASEEGGVNVESMNSLHEGQEQLSIRIDSVVDDVSHLGDQLLSLHDHGVAIAGSHGIVNGGATGEVNVSMGEVEVYPTPGPAPTPKPVTSHDVSLPLHKMESVDPSELRDKVLIADQLQHAQHSARSSIAPESARRPSARGVLSARPPGEGGVSSSTMDKKNLVANIKKLGVFDGMLTELQNHMGAVSTKFVDLLLEIKRNVHCASAGDEVAVDNDVLCAMELDPLFSKVSYSYSDLLRVGSDLVTCRKDLSGARSSVLSMETVLQLIRTDISCCTSDKKPPTQEVADRLAQCDSLKKFLDTFLESIDKKLEDSMYLITFINAKCGQYVESCFNDITMIYDSHNSGTHIGSNANSSENATEHSIGNVANSAPVDPGGNDSMKIKAVSSESPTTLASGPGAVYGRSSPTAIGGSSAARARPPDSRGGGISVDDVNRLVQPLNIKVLSLIEKLEDRTNMYFGGSKGPSGLLNPPVGTHPLMPQSPSIAPCGMGNEMTPRPVAGSGHGVQAAPIAAPSLSTDDVKEIVEASMKEWQHRLNTAISTAVSAAYDAPKPALPVPEEHRHHHTHAHSGGEGGVASDVDEDDLNALNDFVSGASPELDNISAHGGHGHSHSAHGKSSSHGGVRRQSPNVDKKIVSSYAFSPEGVKTKDTCNTAVADTAYDQLNSKEEPTHKERRNSRHHHNSDRRRSSGGNFSEAELLKLKDITQAEKKQIEQLFQHNKEAEQERTILAAKVAKMEITRSSDAALIEQLEDSLRKVSLELRDLQTMRDKDEANHQKEKLASKIELKKLVQEFVTISLELKEKGPVDSYVTTKAMCLGCGRDSLVRYHAGHEVHPTPHQEGIGTEPNSPIVIVADSGGQAGDIDNMSEVSDVSGVPADTRIVDNDKLAQPSTVAGSGSIGGIIQFPVLTADGGQLRSSSPNSSVPLIHPAINSHLNRGIGGINLEAEDILHHSISTQHLATQRQMMGSRDSSKRINHKRIASPAPPARRHYDNLEDDIANSPSRPITSNRGALHGKKSDRAAVSKSMDIIACILLFIDAKTVSQVVHALFQCPYLFQNNYVSL